MTKSLRQPSMARGKIHHPASILNGDSQQAMSFFGAGCHDVGTRLNHPWEWFTEPLMVMFRDDEDYPQQYPTYYNLIWDHGLPNLLFCLRASYCLVPI